MTTPETDSLDDIFGSLITAPIEVIDVSRMTNEQYANYCLTIYERVRLLGENPTSSQLADEALTSANDSTRPTVVSIDEDEIDQQAIKPEDVDHIIEVKIGKKMWDVPILRKGAITKWNKMMNNHQLAIQSKINEICQVKGGVAPPTVWNECVEAALSGEYPELSKAKLKYAQNFITIALADEWLAKKSKEIAEFAEQAEYSIEPMLDGLWIKSEPEGPANKFFKNLATRYVPTTRTLKLDANQTADLVTMMFSSNPGMRARAKLNLSSRVDQPVHKRLMQTPDTSLEIVFAEGSLTSEEILSMVFPMQRDGTYQCQACGIAVNVGFTVYHQQCAVVRWLEKHTNFSYDKELGCIIRKPRLYYSADSRRKLANVLRLHHQLQRDIVIRSGTETTIWKRQPDNTLKKVTLMTRRPEDVPGSTEWLRKNGFLTPPRR